jgi:hypothetical protein
MMDVFRRHGVTLAAPPACCVAALRIPGVPDGLGA